MLFSDGFPFMYLLNGFIYIPYSSLIDEATWTGNNGTSMRYDSIAHIYFGASCKYDYLLDVTIGDVFTTNTYLYDGSLSRYDDFSTHAEKVWEVDYVNIEYVDGYLTELECFAIDFLNDTYPCTTAAPNVWATYKAKFQTLSNEDKETLRNIDYSNKNYNSCSDLEKCCWRYDLAVKNLGLENFMQRQNLLTSKFILTNSNHSLEWLFGIIAGLFISMSVVPLVIFSRRRKETW